MNLQYLGVFIVIFCMVGLRAFQQKVVAANQYPAMGLVGTLIYAAEGTAILVISKGGAGHVIAGALGAGTGVMTFVYLYNRFFTKKVIA